MKSIFTQGGFIFLYVIVISAWVNGCFHSFKKHKDDPEWLQRSPLVVYRGVEYFWHDDFAGVDWEQRIKSDASTVLNLIDLSAETQNIDDTKMQIEKFSQKIGAYPKDKKERLKIAGSRYIKYVEYMTDDMSSYIDSVMVGADLKPEKWDKHPQYFEDSLNKDFDIPDIGTKKILDSVAIMMRIHWGFGEIDKVRDYYYNMKKNGPSLLTSFKDAYYRIFREKYENNN